MDGVWGTGRRQEAPLMVIVGRGCHARTAKRQPTHEIWRGGAREVSRVTRAHRGMLWGIKAPQKQTKRGASKKANGKAKERADSMHRHTYENTKCNALFTPKKTQKQAKTTQAKLTTPNQHYLQGRTKNTQKKETKKRAKTAKEYSENQSNKKSNENRSTICARKNATGAKKTQ